MELIELKQKEEEELKESNLSAEDNVSN